MIKPLNAATTEKGRLKMRLIDADALIKKLRQNKKTVKSGIGGMYTAGMLAGIDFAGVTVTQAPTVEERKHGHWIETNEYYTGSYESLYYYKCSVCGAIILEDVDFGVGNYCQQCGATMDEVVKNDRTC